LSTVGRTDLAGAGAAAAPAGAATAAAADRVLGLDDETVVGHVDLYRAGLGFEALVDQKGESVRLEYFVFFVRLVQSQGQARACSTALREIHADGGRGLVAEVAFELLLGGVCYIKHWCLLFDGRERKR